jgi:hypothetical protein
LGNNLFFLREFFFFSSISFCAVTEVESDERVSKLVTRIYGEVPQSSRRSRGEETEADHEHSDKDSYFSSADGRHSHDQTSTSEASTSSSLDEDSPRLQTPPPALPTNISAPTRSAPARFHRLPSPSGTTHFCLHSLTTL